MSRRAAAANQAEKAPRYVVGFDLGTTNSAVCYVDTDERPWRVRTFLVPQLVAPGQVEDRETLPSFHYEPAPGELASPAIQLPWEASPAGYLVGVFARDHGALVPGRLIASAKSWLCHSGVDRTASILPWQGSSQVERLSPVDASARYLAHVRAAWDAKFPNSPLAAQDFVLTLPASFDEVARELTVKAAARAGLPRVVLIEEPQAAFYAWIDAHRDSWQDLVQPGQKILVCDIGGGTSDFTLIRVRAGQEGKVQFHRVAVGEHLILGGDNLDLALAHHLERKLVGDGHLDPRAWSVLVRLCQQGKERLLGAGAPERLTLNLPGAGARLIGGALQVEVTRDEATQLLVDGFFPRVPLDARPASRQSGFQEFGLPYAPDPAVTRYLAAFLTAHRHVALDDVELAAGHDPARPDIVLFNGGLFESPVLRQRMLDVLCDWFRTPQEPGWSPQVLANPRLDLAVAQGAAYYGMVRRGEGVRIAAGLARTYYVGVESRTPDGASCAVCLLPAGVEPGQEVELGQPFTLLVWEPVEFPLYVSSTRLTDRPGDVVTVDPEQIRALPPIRTVLRTARKGDRDAVSIHLHARLTEIGTLELWCSEVGTRRTWRLEFDVRSATQTDIAAHEGEGERQGIIDEEAWQRGRAEILATFGPEPTADSHGLVRRLAEALGLGRREWPPSLLRRIWETLIEVEAARRKGAGEEARWLNLLGFALRPGYGVALDDWRVAETWRLLQGKLIHPTSACRNEWWILWRRIAGGLTPGQQQALADPLLPPIRALVRLASGGKAKAGDFSFQPQETPEAWRLLGSFELLSAAARTEIGVAVLDLLPRKKMERVRAALAWSLARVGARVPVYGPLNTVVPVETIQTWLDRFLTIARGEENEALAVMQLARRTGDRYRDVSDTLRREAADWLADHDAPPHFRVLVEEGGSLDQDEQGLVFGEALPKGLRIQ